MKFKGVLTDQLCMKDFLNIIATFARLTKRVTFVIKENGLCISNTGFGIGTNLTAWSEIGKENFFSNFIMKGIDEQHDEIWLSLHPEQMSNALNTLKTHFIKSIVIKLTKKQFPCLSIDIEMAPSNSNNFRRLVHDVPVDVIPISEWNEYQIVPLPDNDISIQMPSLKTLRALCDKMKNLAPSMTICCISTGHLSFIVETDSAIVVSRYFNLMNQSSQNNGDDKHLEICCHIETKHLSLCFGSIQFSNVAMVGSILREKAFNLKISVRDNVSLFFTIRCTENS